MERRKRYSRKFQRMAGNVSTLAAALYCQLDCGRQRACRGVFYLARPCASASCDEHARLFMQGFNSLRKRRDVEVEFVALGPLPRQRNEGVGAVNADFLAITRQGRRCVAFNGAGAPRNTRTDQGQGFAKTSG